jgi:homoserine dehydrogenase
MGRLGGSSNCSSSSDNTNATGQSSPSNSTATTTAIINPSLPPCIITKVCVRDLQKPRTFRIDELNTMLCTNVHDIINDEEIDLVVEVMGGTTLAKTVVLESLKKGKSVVTANKALIAEHLDEIHDTVLQSGGKVTFSYEAAVCGGIPIIQALQGCFTGDIVNEVMGICNGTTNYMLGKMEEGAAYDSVLKEAQDLGYAEADPTADVEGHDVRAKIAILAKLAFGTTVPVDSIPCRGITEIQTVDFDYARSMGCTIKLVGTAARLSEYGEHDGAVSVYVTPKIVPLSHLLASARGSGNAVAVSSANMGCTSYTGPGAGRFPTANSVVSDICRVATKSVIGDPFPLQSNIPLDNNYTAAFYIRVSFQDELGIIRRVGELAELHGVSINSVLQNPIKDRLMADFVITTEECKVLQVAALCADIAKQDFAHSEPLYMPLLIE